MIRLDDIPKKSLFEAPEGYFEKLPGRIQTRIAVPEPEPAWGRLALRYALPVVLLAAAAVFVLTNRGTLSPEDLLAQVDSEQLVAYLDETDLNSDDLLEAVPLDEAEAESLEADALGDLVIDDEVFDEVERMEEFDTVGR